jgi:hypothetical protein
VRADERRARKKESMLSPPDWAQSAPPNKRGSEESVSDPRTDVAGECNPGPQGAFDPTKFASCSSRLVAQFAAFFIDPRAE